jgi:hypothetical protein
MKQRNTMITVWTALLIAVGVTLAAVLSTDPLRVDEDYSAYPTSDMRPGERKPVVISRDAVEVRLFVEGLPFREPARTQELINDVDGVRLTKAQRDILEGSLHRYRLLPSEFDDYPACFIPHHFFRYYDRQGNQLADLQICYCCRQVRLNSWGYRWIQGEILQFDFDEVAEMLKTMDVPTDVNCPERR